MGPSLFIDVLTKKIDLEYSGEIEDFCLDKKYR